MGSGQKKGNQGVGRGEGTGGRSMQDGLTAKCLPTGGPEARAPRILICRDDLPRLDEIQQILREENYETRRQRFNEIRPDDARLDTFDLVVIRGGKGHDQDALGFCKRLRQEIGDRFLPIIYLSEGTDPSTRVFSAEAGADSHLALPFDRLDLMSHVQTLVRIKLLQDKVVEQSAELRRMNRRLELAYDLIDKELELARKIQQSFLPRFLPSLAGIRFAVRMVPSGRVGGDFYDVLRLDEQTIAFYVADAMGHGVPASLLTIYVKKGIVPKDVFESSYHLVPPAEVLRRLNVDMLEQQLSENPFVSMAYCSLDLESRVLRVARAGHPYPLLLRQNRPIEYLKAEGTLLGIFETDFDEVSLSLEEGDRVLLFTDGIDSVQYRDQQQGQASFLACIEDHRHLPIDQMIERTYGALFPDGRHDDDFTLFGMEVRKELA